jgi:hypothetical protein
VPLLLIAAGILFILLRFVTKIAGAIEVDPSQRKWTIPIGLFFLTVGLILHFLPLGISINKVGTMADWQNILNGSGFGPLPITGTMDQKTQSETKKFQQDLGLPVTGEVDLITWQAGLNHKKLPGWSKETPSIQK